jgi:CRISPR/Cas system-associated endonuclease Cas1
MEPMRPVVDRAVLRIVRDVTFTGGDFSLQHDGVCRLNPDLARRVVQQVLAGLTVAARPGTLTERHASEA